MFDRIHGNGQLSEVSEVSEVSADRKPVSEVSAMDRPAIATFEASGPSAKALDDLARFVASGRRDARTMARLVAEYHIPDADSHSELIANAILINAIRLIRVGGFGKRD